MNFGILTLSVLLLSTVQTSTSTKKLGFPSFQLICIQYIYIILYIYPPTIFDSPVTRYISNIPRKPIKTPRLLWMRMMMINDLNQLLYLKLIVIDINSQTDQSWSVDGLTRSNFLPNRYTLPVVCILSYSSPIMCPVSSDLSVLISNFLFSSVHKNRISPLKCCHCQMLQLGVLLTS